MAVLVPMPLTPAEGDPCPDYQYIEGLGNVCPLANGLYEVYSPDGQTSLGTSHGLDPVPSDTKPSTPGSPRPVSCVSGLPGEYYTRVFYARATNDVDGYSSWVGSIRSMVENANGLVYEAAVATGGTADLNVKCSGGVIEVTNVVLPTPMASASFSTIVTDMNNMGYTDGKVHHWVFYDDTGACGCGGTGHLYGDDSLNVNNPSNGNGVALFAVDFGYNSVRIMLHELGHNMGAVQDSAPQSTLAGHCYDGLDTMCYNDGGPNGGLYSTGYCSVEVFDCGKNDYFNRNPTGGSYLATHWNIGNSINRYISFGGAPPPPANDPFGSSILASGSSYSNTQSTVGATGESGEPLPCDMSATTVWYRYTPSSSGTLTVNTFSSNFDTVLAAYTGSSVTGLTQQACNDQFSGDQSQITFSVSSGTTYRIQIGGWVGTSANTGTLVLSISLASSGPANNNFANSFLASGSSYTNSQSAAGATSESGEPLPCSMGAATVWYRYTPTSAGTLRVDTFGSNYDTVLGAYTGSSVSGLSQITCNDDWSGLQSQVEFSVSSGVTYRIQAGTFGSVTPDSLVIHVTFTAAGDSTPPVMVDIDPQTGSVYRGCLETVTGQNIRALYVDSGCIRATISDAQSGLSQVRFYYSGSLVASWSNPAGGFFEAVVNTPNAPLLNVEVRLEATNGAGLTTTFTTLVNTVV